MYARLFVDACIEAELDEEAEAELKKRVEDKLGELDRVSDPRVMLKKQVDTTTLGFSVKTNLKELANNPANGRYLGLFIVDDEGEMISEKFILNPAIKIQRGRFSLVLNILQQNNVDKILVASAPEEEELKIIQKMNFEYSVVSTNNLDKLRDHPGELKG